MTDGNGNAITDPNHVGNLNPFRYRGYYMDTETGMYYLMSRYYDPVTHRFLNADGYFQTGLGVLDTNMNAYCGNNPIMNYDPEGTTCREHGYQYIANCTRCNKDYRDFLNGNLDWYNDLMGFTGSDRVIGFNDSGDPIYAYSNATSSALSMTSTAVSFNTGTVFSIASTQGSRALSGGLAAATYAFTTPLNIMSHVTNPWLNNGQKTLAIIGEVAIATIGIVTAIALAANPIGCFVFGLFWAVSTTVAMNVQVNYWETQNKRDWGIIS
ncbi:hypothetical protein GMA14_02045 [Ruminococcus sp. zg-921]|nr:hypothetical protein [Ruminococcus sp. zg-921]